MAGHTTDELVERLLACAAIRDEARRELILERLDIGVRARIARADSLLVDVANIAATCIAHGAVDSLLSALRYVEGDSRAMRSVLEWRARWSDAMPGAEPRVAGPGRLWRVPELPPHFLARPEHAEGLIRDLCAHDSSAVGIASSQKYGVHGMGGLGKTVLAAAVARNEDIRAHFVDGIYWLSVGQEPQITSLQAQLSKALGAPVRGFESAADGRQVLAEYLSESEPC